MKLKIIISVILLSIVYGCGRTLYMPASSDNVKQEQLLAGRKLYIDHCGGCHNLHFPNELDAADWNRVLETMQVKAKISNEEKQQILQYLTSEF